MGKIAVIFTDPSHNRQFIGPLEALRADGNELIQVKLSLGQKAKRKRNQVTMGRAVRSISVEDFDGLVIPRRYTLDDLKKAKDVIKFVKGFVERGKPIRILPNNS